CHARPGDNDFASAEFTPIAIARDSGHFTSDLRQYKADHGASLHRIRPDGSSSRTETLRVVGLCDPLRAHGRRLRGPPGRRFDVPTPEGVLRPFGQPAWWSGIDRLDHGGAGRGSALAARRSLEPGEEHLLDGVDLEPGVHLLRLCNELLATAWRARRRGS